MRVAMTATALGILCLGLAASPGARPSEQQANSLVAAPSEQKAKRLVVLQLLLGDETSARVTVADGGTARIVIKGTHKVGLKPVWKEGGLDLDVVELTKDPTTGAEASRPLLRMSLVTNQAQRFEWAGVPLQVEWVGMKEVAAPEIPKDPAAGTLTGELVPGATPLAAGECDSCCVICGDFRLCACNVEADCGLCCCGQCCEAMDGPVGGTAPCSVDRETSSPSR